MCLAAALLGQLGVASARAAEPASIVLVANPALADPNFARTVVLVVRTPRNETIGVILNRRMRASNAIPSAPGAGAGDGDDARRPGGNEGGKRTDSFFGGPLAPRGLLAVARSNPASPAEGNSGADGPGTPGTDGSIAILPGWRLVVGATRVRALEQAGDHASIKVFVGYAGWAPGQLEREIASGSWVVRQATEELVFDPDPDTQWDRLSASLRAVRRESPFEPETHSPGGLHRHELPRRRQIAESGI